MSSTAPQSISDVASLISQRIITTAVEEAEKSESATEPKADSPLTAASSAPASPAPSTASTVASPVLSRRRVSLLELGSAQPLKARFVEEKSKVAAVGEDGKARADEDAKSETSATTAASGQEQSKYGYDPKQFLKKRPPVTLKQVVRKLNTKEDKMYLHKIFGLLALLSFVYRYFVVFPKTGTLGFDELNFLNIATMAVHTILSCSAIIFKVPLKRVITNPTMIYEEYRLHAIVFTFRCLFVFVLSALTPEVSLEVSGSQSRLDVCKAQLLRFCCVLSMHAVADVVSHFYGESGMTTVRGDETRKPKSLLVRRISLVYASYQLIALGSHLVPHVRGMDMGYNTLIAIQSSAFAMTLNRKGLIRWQGHAAVYGVCLFISTFAIFATMRSFTFTAAVLMAAVCRMRFRVNKYAIWFCFSTCFGLGYFGAFLYTALFCLAGARAEGLLGAAKGEKTEKGEAVEEIVGVKVSEAGEKAAYDQVCQDTVENLK